MCMACWAWHAGCSSPKGCLSCTRWANSRLIQQLGKMLHQNCWHGICLDLAEHGNLMCVASARGASPVDRLPCWTCLSQDVVCWSQPSGPFAQFGCLMQEDMVVQKHCGSGMQWCQRCACLSFLFNRCQLQTTPRLACHHPSHCAHVHCIACQALCISCPHNTPGPSRAWLFVQWLVLMQRS
jgi:hypothetical protein